MQQLAMSTPIIRQVCTPENIDRLKHDIKEKQAVSQMARTDQERASSRAEAMRVEQQLQLLQNSCSY